jgi:N6-adenosine-specific RNA methylase IME4
MIEITAIRLTGAGHEHIAFLQWRNTQTGATGQSTREAVVEWLEESRANQAVVANQGNWVYVGVVTPPSGSKYLRTYADGQWTDNLLSLPQF